MNMKGNFSDLMKEAQKMQAKMLDAQKQLEQLEVTGKAGGDLVAIVMTGKHDAKRATVDESLLDPDEKEVLEDLIVAAINDAVRKIDKEARGKMQDLTKDVKLPPEMQNPFGEGEQK